MQILSPREIYDLQVASRACAYCTTPLTNSSLILRCPTTASSSAQQPCPARFCNRLCLKRSEKTHPLVCPTQNPASIPLLAFAKKHTWMALHALTQCAARLLLSQQQTTGGGGSEDALRDDWRVYRALAELGMEERARGSWCASPSPPHSIALLLFSTLAFLSTSLKVTRRRAGSRDVAGCA